MTTPPQQLSPAAQAVLDAAHCQPFMDADGRPNFAGAVAAALRAAAEGNVADTHRRILAIAAELGGEGEG